MPMRAHQKGQIISHFKAILLLIKEKWLFFTLYLLLSFESCTKDSANSWVWEWIKLPFQHVSDFILYLADLYWFLTWYLMSIRLSVVISFYFQIKVVFFFNLIFLLWLRTLSRILLTLQSKNEWNELFRWLPFFNK